MHGAHAFRFQQRYAKTQLVSVFGPIVDSFMALKIYRSIRPSSVPYNSIREKHLLLHRHLQSWHKHLQSSHKHLPSSIMSNLKVLVVGASIAGLSAAYWLARAGAHVTVIERSTSLRTGGQNIDIRTTGVTVMRKLPGMEAAVRAKTTGIEGISFVRYDGRPFATLTATGSPDQQSLVSEFEIFRGALAKILYDLTKDNKKIKYVFGEQVASMQQKYDGPVTVEFANGFPTSEYDLVVAYDGATSRTRAIGLDCGAGPHHTAQLLDGLLLHRRGSSQRKQSRAVL